METGIARVYRSASPRMTAERQTDAPPRREGLETSLAVSARSPAECELRQVRMTFEHLSSGFSDRQIAPEHGFRAHTLDPKP
jgi:hypothetical protein